MASHQVRRERGSPSHLSPPSYPIKYQISASCRSWDRTKTGTRMGFDRKFGAKYAHVNVEARADRSTMDGLKASLSLSTRDRTCWRYGKCLLKAPVRFRTLESHLFLASGTTSSCLSRRRATSICRLVRISAILQLHRRAVEVGC